MTHQEKPYEDLLLKKYQKIAFLTIAIQNSYSAFFETLKDAVFVTDLKGCFIFFNQAAERLTGYPRDQVPGRHFRMLFTLDDLNDGFLFFYQTMKGCYSEHSKFRIRCRNGSTKVVDVLASPILYNGRVQAALTIAQDVTGKPSRDTGDRERVKVFKKFAQDLERWEDENQQLKSEVQYILQKLTDRPR